MLREFFVLLVIVSVSLAAISIRPLDPKPEEFKNVDGCFIKELYDVVPVGGRKPSRDPAKCEEYICNEQNVQIATCGAVEASPPCRIVAGDVNSLYPGCCATIFCPNNNNNGPCNN